MLDKIPDALKFSEHTRRAVAVIASLFTISVALKTILWPVVNQKLNGGSAVEIHTGKIDTTYTPDIIVNLTFKKTRQCVAKSLSMQITDAKGRQTVSTVDNLGTVQPGERNVNYDMTLSRAVAPGPATGTVIFWHGSCADGPDPKKPATIDIAFQVPEVKRP